MPLNKEAQRLLGVARAFLPGLDPHVRQALEVLFECLEDARDESAMPADWAVEIAKDASPHELLHRLWSKAVGTPCYAKAEWRRLETLLREVDAPASTQSTRTST